ncbi:metal ABC transporter solute-binding protein, Zn/Mn family [Fulvitalea axinellae]
MKNFAIFLAVLLVLGGCKVKKKEGVENRTGKLSVVTTTTMITDLLKVVGGDRVEVQGLMGSGVDPHLYKASEGDVNKLFTADAVFYNGLHLEGKLVDVFEKMRRRNRVTIALADALAPSDLITSKEFAGNHDPHVWFDINLWEKITLYTAEKLSGLDPANADYYMANAKAYHEKLAKLLVDMKKEVAVLPEEKRVLITAHDAFNYFGRSLGFEVVGLQGLSTATEAGVKDVRKLAELIIDKKVKAIFVESSVPKRTIEALQAAVKDQNHNVNIGGTLYSDALGNAGTPEGTYLGMYKYNTETIVNALR